MTCDWLDQDLVETFFDYEDIEEVKTYDDFDLFLNGIRSSEGELKPCRNPVKRTVGFWDKDNSVVHDFEYANFPDVESEESDLTLKFGDRRDHAEWAQQLNGNED